MKKTLFIIGLLFATTFAINAQDISENAIGLRIGSNDGFSAEISYQRALTENNRLEIDLGLRNGSNFDGFKVAGLYQWVWELEQNFNWYAGAGGGLGNYSYDAFEGSKSESETFVFVAGNVGIEYNFPSTPILLSLDYRPEFNFGDTIGSYGSDIAFGVRYQF